MAVTINGTQGIVIAMKHGCAFTKTLMVGRQNILDVPMIINGLKKMKLSGGGHPILDSGYADELFRFLGAQTVDSVDISDYEGATIVHDMNTAIDSQHYNKYSCVYDGGCLEHIFNYPIALKNCMDMVALNGHLVLHTPANNYYGHGFYQFSPELFFSLLTVENGFTDTEIYAQSNRGKWYKVASPSELKYRVDIPCGKYIPFLLLVVSRKIGNVPPQLTVNQSDYVDLWSSGKTNREQLSTFGGLRFNKFRQILFDIYRRLPLVIRFKFINSLLFRQILLKQKIKFYTPYKFTWKT